MVEADAAKDNKNKRKLSDTDNLPVNGSNESPPAKKPKPSSQGPATDGPKPITAAGLSGLKKAKKDPNDTTSATRKGQRKEERQAERQAERPAKKPQEPSPSIPQKRSLSRSRSPPRERKRPGASGRVSASNADVVRRRQEERERATRQAEDANIVTQHYNSVPERGREWRTSGSMIKGLRSFNNWVKSALIQKFSTNEDYTPGARQYGGHRHAPDQGLRILDIGCGKGGDLQKWQNAPQGVEVYVGLDPAGVSVDQARSRYLSMPRFAKYGEFRGRPLFHAEFFEKDCFGELLNEVPIIRDIGVDYNMGPASRGGGFDVVSMMFCMHYAFENEQRARGMLKNVSAALKKGGRFLGVIPNSDVLSAKVKSLASGSTPNGAAPQADHLEDGELEQPKDEAPAPASDDDEWDPEKPSEPQPAAEDDDDGWDPEKTSEKSPANDGGNDEAGSGRGSTEAETENGIEWGNSMYRVKFPGKVPKSGVFRPSYGWKYFFFLEEAVESVPEYVVPWEAFRAMAIEYDLELEYRKGFHEVWAEEKKDRSLGELSERMGVTDRRTGQLLVSRDEMEATSFYHAFCFHKV